MLTAVRAICAILTLLSGLVFAPSADAVVYTVTNTDDSGAGSLREALASSNQTPDIDEIRFAIAGEGPFVLTPRTRFTITEPVIIDGYSQAGARRNTSTIGTDAVLQIVIDGSQVASELNSHIVMQLDGNSTGSMISGLVFVKHRGTALNLTDQSHENHIVGNFFGLQADGRTLAVGPIAVNVFSAENVIGGENPGDRNLMVGTTASLGLNGNIATRNAVHGNLMGVDRDETPLRQAQANAFLILSISSSFNRIGDYSSKLPNVFGGSPSFAVYLHENAGKGNQIAAAKFIGNNGLLYTRSVDDQLDVDDGPNERMNRPVIESAVIDGAGTLRVLGHLDSTPNREFRIALYGDHDGCTQNVYYLGYVTVNSDAIGHAAFDWSVVLDESRLVAVLATAGAESAFIDSTSDFSPCKAASIPTYTISTQVSQGGTIGPQGSSFVIDRSATKTFSVLPAAGYKLDEASGCPGSFSDATTFIAGPIFADCTLTVRFSTIEPRLSPAAVNAGRVGSAYRQTFVASGGYPAYTFSATAAVPGLAFNRVSSDTYAIEGIPAKAGRHVFDVVVKDERSQIHGITYTLIVAKGAQTIDFAPLADRSFPAPPFEPQVTASSGLAVSLASTSPGICSVSNGRVTLLGPGTCSLVASQAGNDDYEAAPSVTRSFTLGTGRLFFDGFE